MSESHVSSLTTFLWLLGSFFRSILFLVNGSTVQDVSTQDLTNNVVVVSWCAILPEDVKSIADAGQDRGKRVSE